MSEVRIQESQVSFFENPDSLEFKASYDIGSLAVGQSAEAVETETNFGIDLSRYQNEIKKLEKASSKNNTKISDLEKRMNRIVEGNTYDGIVLSDSIKMDVFSKTFDYVETKIGSINYPKARSMIDSYNESVRNGSRANLGKLHRNEKTATWYVQAVYREARTILEPVFDKYEVPEEERDSRTGNILNQTVMRYSGASRASERKRLEDATGITARKQASERRYRETAEEILEIFG